MNQKEFIKLIVDMATKREIKISQAVVKELLEAIEESLDLAILDGKVVKAFGCKFMQVEKAETSGVTRLGGKETIWTKPAHRAAKVSYLPSKRKSLEREI